MQKLKTFCIAVLLLILPRLVLADCANVYLAINYRIVGMHNILLYSYNRPIALIKTFSFIYPTSSLQLLKNSFVCDFDHAVFLVDGEDVIDVAQVKSFF